MERRSGSVDYVLVRVGEESKAMPLPITSQRLEALRLARLRLAGDRMVYLEPKAVIGVQKKS